MREKTTTAKKKSSAKDQKLESTKVEKAPKQKKRGSLIISGLALLVAILALAFNYYNLNLYHKLSKRTNEPTVITKSVVSESNKAELTAVSSKLSSLQSQVDAVVSSKKYLFAQQSQLYAKLEASLKELKQPLSQARQQLSQIRYSLIKIKVNMAINLLLTSQNKANIEDLLGQALSIAKSLPDAKNLSVSLEKALSQIEKLPVIDPDKLMPELTKLNSQLINLKIQPPIVKPKARPKQIKAKNWQEHLQTSLESLKQLVIIRHDQDIDKQLLYKSDQVLAVQSIKVNLAQAKWALWQGDQALYSYALSQSSQAISKYMLGSPAKTAWLNSCNALLKLQIRWPDQKILQIVQLLKSSMHALSSKGGSNA